MIPTTPPTFRDRPADMFPRFAKRDIADGSAVNAENICNTSRIEALGNKYTDSDYFIVGKFMHPGLLSNGCDSMLTPIFPIRLTGIPSQVFGAVVKMITIIMTSFHFFGARAYKGFQNKRVNGVLSNASFFFMNGHVEPSTVQLILLEYTWLIGALHTSMTFAPRSYLSEIASFVTRKIRNFFPNLIHSISQKVRPLLAVGCCLGSVGQKGRVLNKITDFPLCLDIGNYITEGGI